MWKDNVPLTFLALILKFVYLPIIQCECFMQEGKSAFAFLHNTAAIDVIVIIVVVVFV